MKKLYLFVLTLTCLVYPSISAVDIDQFNADYKNIEEQMWQGNGEVYKVENFTYKKDAATFFFEKGKVILRRSINGRPTLAAFVGKGRVTINVPGYTNRQRMLAITKDSTVSEDIEVCYMRFADDFDLELKELFGDKKGKLSARENRRIKKAQGNFYFKPSIFDLYDNYFQILRSAYNRKDDGYFFADFNKYVFTFDPNLEEEIRIGYERSLDISNFRASSFQRSEKYLSTGSVVPQIQFPTTYVNQHTDLILGGADGNSIISAYSEIIMTTNSDSVQFLTVFLDKNLVVDSVFCDSVEVSFIRRGSFSHIGIVLPEWKHKQDAIELIVWYHGTDYSSIYPFLNEHLRFSHSLNITAPSSYNYLMLGECRIDPSSPRTQGFEISEEDCHKTPDFIALATGFDTTAVNTSWGLPVNFVYPTLKYGLLDLLKKKKYRNELIAALEFMYDKFGDPVGMDELIIIPNKKKPNFVSDEKRTIYYHSGSQGELVSLSGAIKIPDFVGPTELGAFKLQAGLAASKQWFRSENYMYSYRDSWIRNAVEGYLSLMYVEKELGLNYLLSNLSFHKGRIDRIIEESIDVPLSSGYGIDLPISSGIDVSSKGIWVIHMIRNLMNTQDSTIDGNFYKWLNYVIRESNERPFTNQDFVLSAEKYFGIELGWFAKQWIYGQGVPEYDVSFSSSKENDGYYIDVNIKTSNVDEDFFMPIKLRVELKEYSALVTALVFAKIDKYRFGPFDGKPKKLLFNKYMSVLSVDRVEEKPKN